MGNFFKSLFSSGSKEEPTAEEIEKDKEKNFDILKFDGVRAQRINKLPYAIRCFNEALKIHEDYETRSFLMMAYMASNELEEALEQLNKMVELKPDEVEPLQTRIHVLFMMDRDADALEDSNRMIELAPENALAYFLRAKAKRTTNDALGVIADLTKAISLKDDFADAYQLRAEILLQMNQPSDALEDVQKVVELNPEEELAYLLRGRIYAVMGNVEEADGDFKKVLDLNPFNQDVLLLQGDLLMAQNKPDEAIAFFDVVIEENPDFAKAYAERGRAKNLKGDKKGAFDDLKKSMELNPEGDEVKLVEGKHSNFDNLYKGGIF